MIYVIKIKSKIRMLIKKGSDFFELKMDENFL